MTSTNNQHWTVRTVNTVRSNPGLICLLTSLAFLFGTLFYLASQANWGGP